MALVFGGLSCTHHPPGPGLYAAASCLPSRKPSTDPPPTPPLCSARRGRRSINKSTLCPRSQAVLSPRRRTSTWRRHSRRASPTFYRQENGSSLHWGLSLLRLCRPVDVLGFAVILIFAGKIHEHTVEESIDVNYLPWLPLALYHHRRAIAVAVLGCCQNQVGFINLF